MLFKLITEKEKVLSVIFAFDCSNKNRIDSVVSFCCFQFCSICLVRFVWTRLCKLSLYDQEFTC